MTEDDRGRAEKAHAENLRRKQVRLLDEMEAVDFHSTYCWRRNRAGWAVKSLLVPVLDHRVIPKQLVLSMLEQLLKMFSTPPKPVMRMEEKMMS